MNDIKKYKVISQDMKILRCIGKFKVTGYQRCVDILLRTAIRKRALLRKDCFGMTPLHAAAACGRTVCISLAVELLKEKDFNVLDSLSRFENF